MATAWLAAPVGLGYECKSGRYVADIFYADKEGKEAYLNNLLLEEGHAVRVRDRPSLKKRLLSVFTH